jgi:asparagine synthase (glutamine-hydrolysing)
VRSWLGKDLAPLIAELLSDDAIRRRGFVRPEAVRRMWDDNLAGRADFSLRLYALLSLELWCQTFLDRSWSFERVAPAPLEVPT